MSSKSRVACYFGCEVNGPLHRFPKPQYPFLEKFNSWKMVLNEDIRERDDTYIYNQVRICDNHFEEFYRSASHRLTPNAIPTLNIRSFQKSCHVDNKSVPLEIDSSYAGILQIYSKLDKGGREFL